MVGGRQQASYEMMRRKAEVKREMRRRDGEMISFARRRDPPAFCKSGYRKKIYTENKSEYISLVERYGRQQRSRFSFRLIFKRNKKKKDDERKE